MTEQTTTPETTPGVVNFLGLTLTPDEAWDALDKLAAAISAAPFPAMIVEVDTDEDGESVRVLVCPRCKVRHQPDADRALVVVDTATRWTDGAWYPDEDGGTGGTLDVDYSGSGDYEGLGYLCGSCEKPVDLPAGVEEG